MTGVDGALAPHRSDDADDVCVVVRMADAADADALRRCLRALSAAGGVRELRVAGADADVVAALGPGTGVDGWHDGDSLSACNAAIAARASRHACIVSSDAEPLEGWLGSALATLHRHPRCGVVASRQLRADGWLHQAGRVVWRDGTLHDVGADEPLGDPAWNHAREIDAASAGALLLRDGLLAIGPAFDPRLVLDDADADLSMRARRHGWSTHLAPESDVVQHALPARTTAAAVHSRLRFVARWRTVLDDAHAPPATAFIRARSHALRRWRALVVDHYLPDPGRDAGSRAILQTMDALRDLGFEVAFWPANQHYHPVDRRLLERDGVEVVAGERWGGRVERYLRYAGESLDLVLMSRPDVADGVLEAVARHSRAKRVYYGHDLHGMRMALQAAVSGTPGLAEAAAEMTVLERSVWRRVDLSLYPSREEADVVAAEVGGDHVQVVPLYRFDRDELSAPRAPATDRILFVAGFGHSPNVDAARWLVEDILPRVRARRPDAVLTLAGSNPTADVRALAGGAVSVTGTVDAATLAGLYREASVAVVPLRFGAGVKLKVLEAMARGVPVVTTPVGAQGLPDVDACVAVAADAAAIADAIVGVLVDPATAGDAVDDARAYVAAHYGGHAMRDALCAAFATIGLPVEACSYNA